MKTEELIKKIKNENWNKYRGLKGYQPEKVVPALLALVNLNQESDNFNVYNDILFSIGNNHAGTYYPAVESALEFILIIAIRGVNEISRNCALEILTDIYFSFEPSLHENEPGAHEAFQKRINKAIESSYEGFLQIETSNAESDRNRQLARDLLTSISTPQ